MATRSVRDALALPFRVRSRLGRLAAPSPPPRPRRNRTSALAVVPPGGYTIAIRLFPPAETRTPVRYEHHQQPASRTRRLAAADKEVVQQFVARLRRQILQEIEEAKALEPPG